MRQSKDEAEKEQSEDAWYWRQSGQWKTKRDVRKTESTGTVIVEDLIQEL